MLIHRIHKNGGHTKNLGLSTRQRQQNLQMNEAKVKLITCMNWIEIEM